jgi:hypothetical protein
MTKFAATPYECKPYKTETIRFPFRSHLFPTFVRCLFEMGQTTHQTSQYQFAQHQTTQFPICSYLFPSRKLSNRNGSNHIRNHTLANSKHQTT